MKIYLINHVLLSGAFQKLINKRLRRERNYPLVISTLYRCFTWPSHKKKPTVILFLYIMF